MSCVRSSSSAPPAAPRRSRGKLLLAFAEGDVQELEWRALEDTSTMPNAPGEQLRDQLQQIRRSRWATSVGEREEGVRGSDRDRRLPRPSRSRPVRLGTDDAAQARPVRGDAATLVESAAEVSASSARLIPRAQSGAARAGWRPALEALISSAAA